jgi:hypothetical protein
MAVPPVLVVDFDHPARSQRERTRREDRRLKFYGLRECSEVVVEACFCDPQLGGDVGLAEAVEAAALH